MSSLHSLNKRAPAMAMGDASPQEGEYVASKVVYVGSIPNSARGALHGIIMTAKDGRAKISTTQFDNRNMWARNRSVVGECILAVVIILNAVVLGLSSGFAKESVGWLVADGFFAAFFLVEMILKMARIGFCPFFLGRDLRFRICQDVNLRWRLMEAVLVVLALLELLMVVSISSPRSLSFFRLLRLARIARIARLGRLKVFSELLMMIHGALGGMRTFLCSIFTVALPLYAASVLFVESLGDDATRGRGGGSESFANVGSAFFTLFRCFVAGECTTREGHPIFVLIAENYGSSYAALYCAILFVMTFGLFNVIISLYIENILAATKHQTVFQKRQRLLDTEMFAKKAKALVEFVWYVWEDQKRNSSPRRAALQRTKSVDVNDAELLSTIQITPEFFDHLRSFREFQDLLNDLDVADEDQLDLFDTLDVDGSGTVDLEELVMGICKLRGDARRSDIVGVMLMTRSLHQTVARMDERLTNQSKMIQRVSEALSAWDAVTMSRL